MDDEISSPEDLEDELPMSDDSDSEVADPGQENIEESGDSDQVEDDDGSLETRVDNLPSSVSLPSLVEGRYSSRTLPSSCSLPGTIRRRVRNYSSSSEEEGQREVAAKFRRRKKRKRPVGEQERKTRQKSVWIEEALRSGDKDKLSQLAVSHGGLLSDEIRLRVWPRLLGINMLESNVLPGEEEIVKHPEYNQVVLDVNRSLKRFPPGIEEAARPALQDQLTRLIVRVLLAHPGLHYYQGYHDVAITFLLVVGEHLGYQIMERLSVSHLNQFMAPNMEQTMSLLQVIYPIIRRSSPTLHSRLKAAELGTIFALPWLITWFGHVLPEYPDVVRLYDFFLAGPPLMPVYLAAAIVLHREEEIHTAECEMSAIHGLLSKIPVNLPFEDLLVKCQELYEKFPPYSVEKEAREEMRRERELVEGRRPGRKSDGYGQLLSSFVIYGAPVLIGVVIWRVYSSLQS